jgi:hypothetical protein
VLSKIEGSNYNLEISTCSDQNEDEFSDSDFGEDDVEHEDAQESVTKLCSEFSSKLDSFNESSNVITMAEVIKRLSFHQLDITEDGVEINRMPRNTIRKFYKFMKELIRTEAEFEDLEHFKRLLVIQLSTHSRKIINFCLIRFDSFAKRLKSENYNEVNEFVSYYQL